VNSDGVDQCTIVECTPGPQSGVSEEICNGIDDDCDGDIDEDYVIDTSCFLPGICAASNQASSCTFGSETFCQTGTPEASDACDGLDNDCDNNVDEDFLSTSTNCGVGACSAIGLEICDNGNVVDTCLTGTPALNDTTCDAVDDDCDGTDDEDYVELNTICGIGACQSNGTTMCDGGVEINSCTNGTAAANDNVCNGIDDDCDGNTDEDFETENTVCGVGECSSTGETSCIDGNVSNSCIVGSPATEICDGLNNDCDAFTDENELNNPLTQTCYTGPNGTEDIGICTGGTQTCIAGSFGVICPGEVTPAVNDTTCDNRDQNCDGVPDEGYLPTETFCGVDLCSNEGTLSCINGSEIDDCTDSPPTTAYPDTDEDDFGDQSGAQDVCTLPPGFVLVNEDCNDNNASINPGAFDICNEDREVINLDCNPGNDGDLDCNTFCGDADGDGYVVEFDDLPGFNAFICSFIASEGDCNDFDDEVSPALEEVCDGKDNNCDEIIDEGCPATDKFDALEELSSYTGSDKAEKEVDKAIKELQKSLGNLHPNGDKKIVWIDSEHLQCKHGFKAFDKEKKAVEHLGQAEDPSLDFIIDAIVNADRNLALVAIAEAPAGKDKDKAQEHFDKGESKTKPKDKIKEYRNAWKSINKKCDSAKKSKTSCIEEITVKSPTGDSVTQIGDNVKHPNTVFTDDSDNQVAIHTSCSRCIQVGDVIDGWNITDIIEDGRLTEKCS